MRPINPTRRLREFQAPETFQVAQPGIRVFLAGSIEMGRAENWQQRFIADLVKAYEVSDVDVLNPRRDDWDSSGEQVSTNPQFSQQVNWELDALESANLIVMHFDPKTRSPITLLEMGLCARSDKKRGPSRLVVCCPDGFWRQGNVHITCNKYGVPYFTSYDAWFNHIRDQLTYQRQLLLIQRQRG